MHIGDEHLIPQKQRFHALLLVFADELRSSIRSTAAQEGHYVNAVSQLNCVIDDLLTLNVACQFQFGLSILTG
ncbi:Uncharacterised protein [Mycobacteroides abscessus subsp. bolletii]|nr:Uncharacterised protein [Mycobacteroides abscessus subsp. bolletii]SKP58199.1 Uncharacterised protein [Mycobacteroides abscessus subsp. bolletii]SKP80817.1 Uncharacterised protein [Mycobacteroides abscessus subsp. bolletii]SKQ36623.1 Uncharacterised protein [Mycobacteroides abscessus subsp. bolletii]